MGYEGVNLGLVSKAVHGAPHRSMGFTRLAGLSYPIELTSRSPKGHPPETSPIRRVDPRNDTAKRLQQTALAIIMRGWRWVFARRDRRCDAPLIPCLVVQSLLADSFHEATYRCVDRRTGPGELI